MTHYFSKTFLHNIFGFEGIVSISLLVVPNRIRHNLQQKPNESGWNLWKMGVIKAGTNARYQTFIANGLTCKY